MFTTPFAFLAAPAGGGYDPDAQAFFTAAGITDTTEKDAVNTLVLGMKAEGIWTLVDAAYPFVGGTTDSTKYNLVNPVDSDAAFRLTYFGSWTINSYGAKPVTANSSYANTHLDLTINRYNNHHFLGYTSDFLLSEQGFDGQGGGYPRYCIVRTSLNEFYDLNFAGNAGTINNGSGGCYILNRRSASDAMFGAALNTSSYAIKATGGGGGVMDSYEFYIGKANNIDAGNTSLKQFVSLGQGMSDAQAAAYCGLIEDFQVTLSREYAKI
jgi:hypothetical protein